MTLFLEKKFKWSKLTNHKIDTNISISSKDNNQAPKYTHSQNKEVQDLETKTNCHYLHSVW